MLLRGYLRRIVPLCRQTTSDTMAESPLAQYALHVLVDGMVRGQNSGNEESDPAVTTCMLCINVCERGPTCEYVCVCVSRSI